MTAYMLYHNQYWMAESESLAWVRDTAMSFHRSAAYATQGWSVFILPRRI